MVGLLESLDELFQTRDLYQVLGFSGDKKEASASQLKKAYHKSSLKYHPDRVVSGDQALATKKFQALGAVYKVLSDQDAKKVYDESGEIPDEDNSVDADRDWIDYWRLLFRKVTLEDVKKFEDKYRESAEEEEDLKAAYLETEGKMQGIIDRVLCSTSDDEQRFYEKIQTWIEQGSVPEFPGFKKQMSKVSKAKRAKKAASEASEAAKLRQELGLDGSENSLANVIKKRQADREKQADSFFDQLEAKYAKPSKKKTKK